MEKTLPSQKDVGDSLVRAAARGPSGLDAKAKAAYALISDAASAGVRKYAESGDYADVCREVSEQRHDLVKQVIQEIRSGHADVESIAEFLVDSALARVSRCVQGTGAIYEELWGYDEGRASVAAVREDEDAVKAGLTPTQVTSAGADILIDEQPRTRGDEPEESLRPLFARVLPHVFARPTAFTLIAVFEVFRHRGGRNYEPFSAQEREKIEAFLDAADRTPCMKRCRAEAQKLQGRQYSDAEWRARLWEIWFHSPGPSVRRACGFEHVFVGEASLDERGRDVVGGFHNWFKFYLEEQRGTARYLGQRYPGRTKDKQATRNPRFVSGRFTWDFEGRHLVKDVGGFFVGVSPEWQLAMATAAFFETETEERALTRKWSREPLAREEGWTRTAKLGRHVYRLTLRRGDGGCLTTFFAAQIGIWDERARLELDEPHGTAALEEKLGPILVLHGFADEPELLECAAKVGAAGAFTLREALRHLRTEMSYKFEALLAGDCEPAALELLAHRDFRKVAEALVEAAAEGALTSGSWVDLLADLKERVQLPGRRLYRPLRLALTGRLQGHDLRVLLRLLELSAAGAPWSGDLVPLKLRIKRLQRWLADTASHELGSPEGVVQHPEVFGQPRAVELGG